MGIRTLASLGLMMTPFLGAHIFRGNMAVRAMSMSSSGGITQRASFGAGCFWGTEKFFDDDFGKKFPGTNIKGKVGYQGLTGKEAPNPGYREVCSGKTGHVEAYDFEFNGDELTYEELVKHFFKFHDPTTMNRQGNDRGTQYASVIFAYDTKQIEIAERVKAELQAAIDSKKFTSNYQEKTIKTAVVPATPFFAAESEHQQYLANNPFGYW
jgi:peptide-methionine (S)-S-oxide reductase